MNQILGALLLSAALVAPAQAQTKYFIRQVVGPASAPSTPAAPVAYAWTLVPTKMTICQAGGTYYETMIATCSGSDGSVAASPSSCTGTKPTQTSRHVPCTPTFQCTRTLANYIAVDATGVPFTATGLSDAMDKCNVKTQAARTNSLCSQATPGSNTSWKFYPIASASQSPGTLSIVCEAV